MKQAIASCVLAIVSTGCAVGESRASLDSSEIGSYGVVSAGKQIGTAPILYSNENRPPASSTHVVAPDANVALATTQSAVRLVVYTATLRVVVASTNDALTAVQKIADEAGGYLQESATQSITIRVPATVFDATVGKLDRLGEVVDRAIKASDVSEQMLDFDIRLDNLRRTRDRLAAHLAKSDRMEDTIKIEAELSRVTTELERFEAGRRLLQSQIAMSTIRVELNAARPQTARGESVNSPFRWIDQLGDGLAGVAEAMPRQPVFLGGGPKFDPPAGFVRYFSSKNRVEAMNAKGVRLRLTRNSNFDRASSDFWQSLARKSLVENRSVAITGEWSLEKISPWSDLSGTREVAGTTLAYELLLSRTDDSVWALEVWGPKAEVDELGATTRRSAESVRR